MPTSGDDLAIFLFLLGLASGLGLEAVKAETALRRIVFWPLCGICIVTGAFWLQIKNIWPPFTEGVGSVATSPLAWFVVIMFILAVFAFHRPKGRHPATTESVVAITASAPPVVPAIPVSPPTVPPSVLVPKVEERVFVDTTPEYLMGLLKDRPRVQGNKLTAPYIGKWLRLAGTVDDIFPGFVVLREETGKPGIYLYFGDDQKERFHLLELGKQISAIGQIRAVMSSDFEMESCELVS
jgi:hypothetical protein